MFLFSFVSLDGYFHAFFSLLPSAISPKVAKTVFLCLLFYPFMIVFANLVQAFTLSRKSSLPLDGVNECLKIWSWDLWLPSFALISYTSHLATLFKISIVPENFRWCLLGYFRKCTLIGFFLSGTKDEAILTSVHVVIVNFYSGVKKPFSQRNETWQTLWYLQKSVFNYSCKCRWVKRVKSIKFATCFAKNWWKVDLNRQKCLVRQWKKSLLSFQ